MGDEGVKGGMWVTDGWKDKIHEEIAGTIPLSL